MAASSILTVLDSALDDLELRMNRNPFLAKFLKKQRIILRNLKAFVLCSKKLGNHPDLGSLLVKIEDAVGRYAKEIHRLFDASNAVVLMPRLTLIGDEILCFEKEIDRWCIILSYLTGGSSCLTADEIVGITDSVLGNTLDFPTILRYQSSQLVSLTSTMEVMGVHLTFLKNFLWFAIQTCVDHRHVEDLLTHFEAVAVDAALLFVRGSGIDESDEKWSENLQLKCSILLQKITPVDPQVCQMYTRALRSSKLLAPTRGMDHGSMIVMKNLLDSLISLLWDVLRLETCHNLDLIKDQRQVLYEGLRFLRTILKQQPGAANLDEKIRDQIGDLVCYAGVFVFSFFQAHVKVNPGLQVLCERIEVEANVPQKLILNPPSMNELEFVDSLLESLMELTNSKGEPIAKALAETIGAELEFIRSFLKETEEVRDEQEELQILWNRVLNLAYRVEFFIQGLAIGDISNSISVLSASIIEASRDIKTAVLKIYNKGIKVRKETRTHQTSQVQGPPTMTNEVVGFHDEAKSIINRLTRGSTWLKAVVICGMVGAGKTTLVSKVYNDPYVKSYFPVRAWCSVTQVVDKRLILTELLNQISPGIHSEMSDNDLEEQVHIGLRGRRYLIILDDIWDVETWYRLRYAFPSEDKQSRILLTSQFREVVQPNMLDNDPHFIRPLTEYESLELLQRKLFDGNDPPATWSKLGKQIAAGCKGLPLTVVSVAGHLATVEPKRWEQILASRTLFSSEQFMNTVEWSYKTLPNHLKPCFLYFGAFSEEQEISSRRLIRLWIAEGLVSKTEEKGVEDVAEEYLQQLIDKSLVMVVKKRSSGGAGAKTCQIHNLYHQFCLRKFKEVTFVHPLNEHHQLSDFNEPNYLWRLCIGYDGDHVVKESKLFCPRARSLLFLPDSEKKLRYERYWHATSFIFTILKFLQVLDLEQIHLGDVFPNEIELLFQLKYLAVRGNMTVIPSFIGNLSNLETFVVNLERVNVKVLLPHTIWDLQKLKWLSINAGGGVLPIENGENSSKLFELLSFSGAVFHSCATMEKQLQKFPNMRRLKCDLSRLFVDAEISYVFVFPDALPRLKSLHLLRSDFVMMNRVIFDFQLPDSLKKLTLSRFGLPWTKISTIGQLPQLEILKLLDSCFIGDTWDVEEDSFLKLRFLKLSKLNIVTWKGSSDQFASLEKLVLDHCSHLEEIPSSLEYCPTLDIVEVSNCSGTVANLVRKMEKARSEDWGNSGLKVRIQSTYEEAFEPF